jgi:hypothetical protein
MISADVCPRTVLSNTVKDPLIFTLPPNTVKALVPLLPVTNRNVSDPAPSAGVIDPSPSAFEADIMTREGPGDRLLDAII